MKILRREDYDDLDFQRRLEYINRAIIESGVRSKAYKKIGIAKSTVESMMKSNDCEFSKELNQFVHSNGIEEVKQRSKYIADTEEHSNNIEGDVQNSTSVALMEQNSINIALVEQQTKMMQELYDDWHILRKIIDKHKNKVDIIDVDTTVKLADLPDSHSKSINLRLNEQIWTNFNKHIKKKHKGISQKNMVEIALLQFIKDNK